MSDRLAVFNEGRIEQVGTPSEVYEQPATGFVAGFVGVSNVLEGEAARAVTGSTHAVTIRPEKIHLEHEPIEPSPELVAVAGMVTKVVYLGAFTRYVVELESGGELVVVQQNLRTSSMEVLKARGQRVWISWESQHARPVEQQHREGSSDPEEEIG